MPKQKEKKVNAEYQQLVKAFDFFNKKLFEGKLPEPLITLRGQRSCLGYFRNGSFNSREKKAKLEVDEIALNPDYFKRSEQEVLSTLVHEMCHAWQQHFGERKSRLAYHNKEWANKMIEVGLMPSHDGTKEGKITGQKMTHYIIEGKEFDKFCNQLLKRKFMLNFKRIPEMQFKTRSGKAAGSGTTKKSKVKYSCNICGLNAWAKPNVSLKCGDCDRMLDCHD